MVGPRPGSSRAHDATARAARALLSSWQSGDALGIARLLARDATLLADGGGMPGIPQHEVRGAAAVSRALVDIAHSTSAVRFVERTVNGAPGIVLFGEEHVVAVTVVAVRRRAISQLWVITSPEKLTHWKQK